jgi:hypothetical protein
VRPEVTVAHAHAPGLSVNSGTPVSDAASRVPDGRVRHGARMSGMRRVPGTSRDSRDSGAGLGSVSQDRGRCRFFVRRKLRPRVTENRRKVPP